MATTAPKFHCTVTPKNNHPATIVRDVSAAMRERGATETQISQYQLLAYATRDPENVIEESNRMVTLVLPQYQGLRIADVVLSNKLYYTYHYAKSSIDPLINTCIYKRINGRLRIVLIYGQTTSVTGSMDGLSDSEMKKSDTSRPEEGMMEDLQPYGTTEVSDVHLYAGGDYIGVGDPLPRRFKPASHFGHEDPIVHRIFMATRGTVLLLRVFYGTDAADYLDITYSGPWHTAIIPLR